MIVLSYYVHVFIEIDMKSIVLGPTLQVMCWKRQAMYILTDNETDDIIILLKQFSIPF